MKLLLLFMTIMMTLNADTEAINLLDEVEVDGELRPRYELANDGVHSTANALTLRANLGLKSKKLFDVENLGVVAEFNANKGVGDFDVINDPTDIVIGKGALYYQLYQSKVLLGREKIELDNQRFIGSDDFRQLYQSFDALSVEDKTFENINIFAAYINSQNSISALTNNKGAFLLNAAYSLSHEMTIAAYAYMIAAHSDTYGISVSGDINSSTGRAIYRAEIAKQVNPTLSTRTQNVNALYYNISLEAEYLGFFAGLNYELLGGGSKSTDASFATPYASRHDFNGAADIFVITPTGGFSDVHTKVGYKSAWLGTFQGDYHFYTSDNRMLNANLISSTNLGSEVDMSYKRDIESIKGVSALFEAAFYFAGTITQGAQDYTNSVQKVWLSLDYNFKL